MVSDSLGLSFQIKWFTDCQCKPVAMLHSPFVTLCHPVPLSVLWCTWLLWNIFFWLKILSPVKICCIALITNACTPTAEKAHVLHLLLFKGCFAKAYLRRDNDFGVTFFEAHQLSPSFPRFCFANFLASIARLPLKKKTEDQVQDMGLRQSAPHFQLWVKKQSISSISSPKIPGRHPKLTFTMQLCSFRTKELESGFSISCQRFSWHSKEPGTTVGTLSGNCFAANA